MAVPTNTVQQDGIGTVTADQYNTFLQGSAGLNGLSNFGSGGLQNFVGAQGMVTFVPGLASINDGNQGTFYWNASGNANDGINNIQPSGVSLGCWTRIPLAASSSGPINYTNAVNFITGGNIASSSTVAIGAASGNNVTITGTTTITAFDTVQAGTWREVTFAGVLTLTYNAVSMILPTAANITTAAGDTAGFLSLGSGNWRCMWYQRANGEALFSSGTGIQSVHTQTFTSTGTYTPTIGLAYAICEVVGAGGGGGGGDSTPHSGAGGGAGEYIRVLVSAATLGTSQTITLGPVGSAGSSSGGNGGNGGSASIGSLIVANGGFGGTGGSTQPSPGSGGFGGTVPAGGLDVVGQSGGNGTNGGSFALGGPGGSGIYGGGGALIVQSSGSNSGANGTGYGSGGSGGCNGAAAGGAGAPGIIIITEYCTQ